MTHLKSGINQQADWKKFFSPSMNTSVIFSAGFHISGSFMYDEAQILSYCFTQISSFMLFKFPKQTCDFSFNAFEGNYDLFFYCFASLDALTSSQLMHTHDIFDNNDVRQRDKREARPYSGSELNFFIFTRVQKFNQCNRFIAITSHHPRLPNT